MKAFKPFLIASSISILLTISSFTLQTNSRLSKIEQVKAKKWQLIESIEEKADTIIKESVNGLVFHFTDTLVHFYRYDKELKFDGSVKAGYKESENKIFIYDSKETASELQIESIKQNQFKARVNYLDLENNKILYRYIYTFKVIN